jgi:hypothetical protein
VVTPLAEKNNAAVYHCPWQELVPVVEAMGGVDALIVDAPYSEVVHSGHNNGSGTSKKKRFADYAQGKAAKGSALGRYAAEGGERRSLNYDHWTPANVDSFVDSWAPHVRGWWVTLTDHILAPHWESALKVNGLYTFSPLACIESGSRVRMAGDGPAQWSCWAIVARPKGPPYSKWGSLPGGYVVPSGGRGEWRNAYGGDRVVGGKPPWLMERLVEDYSRAGDLVLDPCCGAGTTLRAAQVTGRRAIGCDQMLEHAQIAARRISAPVPMSLLPAAESQAMEQVSLIGGDR